MNEKDPLTVFEEDMPSFLDEQVQLRKTGAGVELMALANGSSQETNPLDLVDKAKELVDKQEQFRYKINRIKDEISHFSTNLRTQLEQLGVLTGPIAELTEPKDNSQPQDTDSQLNQTPIDTLGVTDGTLYALKRNFIRNDRGIYVQGNPIRTISQLALMSDEEIMNIKNIGFTRLKEIKAKLLAHTALEAFLEPEQVSSDQSENQRSYFPEMLLP